MNIKRTAVTNQGASDYKKQNEIESDPVGE